MKLCYQLVLAALLCISQARATEWLTLSEETLPQWLQLPVTVEAIAAATVSAQTSGRIIELPYDVNDLVPQGAVIVRFSDSEQRARLQQAQHWYARYGRWSLLLSWMPVIGDPLTLVAGVMRERLWIFVAIVTLAKAGRYAALAAITLAWV